MNAWHGGYAFAYTASPIVSNMPQCCGLFVASVGGDLLECKLTCSFLWFVEAHGTSMEAMQYMMADSCSSLLEACVSYFQQICYCEGENRGC